MQYGVLIMFFYLKVYLAFPGFPNRNTKVFNKIVLARFLHNKFHQTHRMVKMFSKIEIYKVNNHAKNAFSSSICKIF